MRRIRTAVLAGAVFLLGAVAAKPLQAADVAGILKGMMADLGGTSPQPQHNGKLQSCAYGGTKTIEYSASAGASWYRGTYSNCREKDKTVDAVYEIEIENDEVVDFKERRSINGKLFDAVRRADHKEVMKFIRSSADVNYSERVSMGGGNEVDNWTPLMSAVVNNDKVMVEILLQGGAWINCLNSRVVNALWLAAVNGRAEIAKLLIARGAYVNNSNFEDMTPLMAAAMNGHQAVVRLLLKAGADKNRTHKEGDSALMFAVARGHAEVVRLLIDSGCDVLLRNVNGISALHIAAAENKPDLVKLLIAAGADRMARDRIGRTALEIASSKGFAGVVELLK